jgi:hypothetical protein
MTESPIVATGGDTRLNLFTANTQTLRSLLYGKTPQVDVARRFADSEDDEARVASEMMERILNTDLEKDSDTAAEAFRQALDDRLLAGNGERQGRLRGRGTMIGSRRRSR